MRGVAPRRRGVRRWAGASHHGDEVRRAQLVRDAAAVRAGMRIRGAMRAWGRVSRETRPPLWFLVRVLAILALRRIESCVSPCAGCLVRPPCASHRVVGREVRWLFLVAFCKRAPVIGMRFLEPANRVCVFRSHGRVLPACILVAVRFSDASGAYALFDRLRGCAFLACIRLDAPFEGLVGQGASWAVPSGACVSNGLPACASLQGVRLSRCAFFSGSAPVSMGASLLTGGRCEALFSWCASAHGRGGVGRFSWCALACGSGSCAGTDVSRETSVFACPSPIPPPLPPSPLVPVSGLLLFPFPARSCVFPSSRCSRVRRRVVCAAARLDGRRLARHGRARQMAAPATVQRASVLRAFLP